MVLLYHFFYYLFEIEPKPHSLLNGWGLYNIEFKKWEKKIIQGKLAKFHLRDWFADKLQLTLWVELRNCITEIDRAREMIGVGKIKQYTNVLDRPLSKGKQEVLVSFRSSIPFCPFCLATGLKLTSLIYFLKLR